MQIYIIAIPIFPIICYYTFSLTTHMSDNNMLKWNCRLFNGQLSHPILSTRGIGRIPAWDNHIRFDPKSGRKRPCQDVLDRFKRLHNGMWIRAKMGRYHLQYKKDEHDQKLNNQWETCTEEECAMLDAMVTPFWLRQRHYVDDHLKPFQTRYGLTSPRVDERNRFVREREKILLDDLTSDRFFQRLPLQKTKARLLVEKNKSDLPKLLKKATKQILPLPLDNE